jgi:hypothetical protein
MQGKHLLGDALKPKYLSVLQDSALGYEKATVIEMVQMREAGRDFAG